MFLSNNFLHNCSLFSPIFDTDVDEEMRRNIDYRSLFLYFISKAMVDIDTQGSIKTFKKSEVAKGSMTG